jgi:ubiquinone/menaquinone biosynthesis C-methylase UbiE
MLPQIYAANEYYSYGPTGQVNPIVLKARLARDQQKVAAIVPARGKPAADMTIIDIGAGDGSLLEAFRLAGTPAQQLWGSELDATTIQNLEARGFKGVLQRAEEMDFPSGTFDAVTMIQVIEHVAEPMQLIQRLHGMMSPGGILFMETPNMASWDRRFFSRRTWGGYHFPRHWTLWDPETMTQMLHRSGFDVVSITTLPAAVIWVWSVNHLLQHYFGNGRLARFFSMNNPLALAPFWFLELLPGWLGRSGNMRVVARRR